MKEQFKVLFYVFVLTFLLTVITTFLGILNVVEIDKKYLTTLFSLVVIDSAVAVIVVFKNAFSRVKVFEEADSDSSISKFSWYEDQEGVSKSFSDLSVLVSKATKRIIVFSGHAGGNENDTLGIDLPSSRVPYLHEIENSIRRKIETGEKNHLTYVRILQISEPLSETLTPDKVDSNMYRHCKEMFNIASLPEAHDMLTFDLFFVPPVVSCPTIIVIDDIIVGLGVVGEKSIIVEGEWQRVRYMPSAVFIHDSSGKACEHYARVIERLKSDATRVMHVSDGIQ